MPEGDLEILLHRCDRESLPDEAVICLHHKKLLLDLYTTLQKKCCNPFKLHEDIRRKGLRPVTLSLAKQINQTTGCHTVKAGMKLCTACRMKDLGFPSNTQERVEDQETEAMDTDTEYVPHTERVETFNQSMTGLGISPCKLTRISPKDKVSYVTRKVKQVKERSKALLSVCAELPVESLESPVKKSTSSGAADRDIDYLVSALKEKVSVSSKGEQISLLSLAPKSWTIQKVIEEFGVTEYMVKKARKLQAEKGILPVVPTRKGHTLSNDTVKQVLDFFYDDEISRLMPGSKDFKSVKEDGARIQKQKRLLLLNLNEAYQLFKTKYPGSKIGISKFCELRPRECITVGARGTHSVCVCTVHHNVKLMLAAFPMSEDTSSLTYHNLLDQLVCSTDSNLCMIHRCDNCPGITKLQEFLQKKISDEVDQIKYKQWVSTDRTTLTDHVATPQEFIECLAEKTDKLAVHHFIAKHQSGHLKSLKEHLTEDSCIMLLDFAENYSFLVQDAAQGYHWDNSQCTLHPFAIYIKARSPDGTVELKSISVCIISDCLKHDTIAVHAFLKKVVPFVSNLHPQLKKIIYFSDGSAAQYKNFKNFTNLLMHQEDFGMSAEWHFFATSHGKSPCDGIGGTVKRLAARASLQAVTENHILTAIDLFAWAEKHIKNINFIWVCKEDVTQCAQRLQKRFSETTTIPGTRDNHSFIPVTAKQLKVSRVSGGPGFIVDMSGSHPHVVVKATEKQQITLEDAIPGKYVVCMYDQQWWVGNICDTSEEQDVKVTFMHPHGPSKSFSWPTREDICWVPLPHIIKIIDAPVTSTGRKYKLPTKLEKEMAELFK